jgi:3-deoxy-7-phosphoheptulonate synthase
MVGKDELAVVRETMLSPELSGSDISWPNRDKVVEVVRELEELPPLVEVSDVMELQRSLALVAEGRAVVLQAGDCAETFDNNSRQQVTAQVNLLRRLSATLQTGSGRKVVTIARIAGQYFKPRSQAMEPGPEGERIYTYRGDAINSRVATWHARTPDPERLLRAYWESVLTHEFLGELRAPENETYPLYVGHEALSLTYERSMSRFYEVTQRTHCLSAHLVWIGMRTSSPTSAHVRWAASVEGPVGVKVGPHISGRELVQLAECLDPDRVPGRLTYIVRMGAHVVEQRLPDLISTVHESGWCPVWVCDPMHGNTVAGPAMRKTRKIDDIAAEIEGFLQVHRALGTHAGGLHLEVSGAEVTECIGGNRGRVSEANLAERYLTACDPRLNGEQALELLDRYSSSFGDANDLADLTTMAKER